MKSEKLILLGVLTLAAIVLILVLWIVAIIGAMDITDGCLYRYNVNGDKSASSSSSIMNSVTLKANANYTAFSSASSEGVELDPNAYGKWLNTNLRLKSGQKVDLVVKGEVSLCKAYIPAYNLQQNSNLDKAGKLIEVPRVADKSLEPVNLIFDAKTDEWRNIAQVFKNDHIVVAIHPDKKSTVGNSTVYNNFMKRMEEADCTEGKRAYNPICGRYSIWNSGSTYVSTCKWNSKCFTCNCRDECKGWNLLGWCITGYKRVCDWCGCHQNVMGTAPEPYRNDGKYTSPWRADVNALNTKLNQDCRNNWQYVMGDWQNRKYFWFSADTATGLLYRYDSKENPTNKKSRGSNFGYSKIESNQSNLNPNADYRVIRDEIYTASDVAYLQYRNHDTDMNFSDNTGGYVLNIKQTKCRRENGNSFNDTYSGRGNVQYIIADYGKNPNNDTLTPGNILLDANGSGSITTPSNKDGYLWLRINNDPNDYKDSFGQYRVDFMTTIEQGGFYHDVLDPFFQGFKNKIKGAAEQIFKNMTCYKGISGSGGCTNFFNYVKGLLSLYIMIYGMMFLIGMVQISQTDLVLRVIKIAFVAGLLNEKTFEFFNDYVFDFVTGFTDDIISNMAGYSIFSGSTTISNPFMFLNEVMTKIFLSSTFIAQVLALLSMGMNGVIYFILIFVCIVIVVIVLLRAIAIYLMAFMAITVLIGLTPLFLTFILFERTAHLFDNWVKFMFRYMLEPVVLLAGIIILTQLFTIYLDFVVGYSVCWKCALPIKLPFPSVPGVTPAFLDVEIFCFNWFAPWGFDHRSSQMGLNMQNMVVLLMLAYCMWGYVDFSGNIVARLAGSAGGPSATGMGSGMASAIGEKALSTVGLDKQSRAQIKAQIKDRLKSMESADKKMPIDSTNRKDIKPSSGNEPGQSGTSDEPGKSSQSSISDDPKNKDSDPQLNKTDPDTNNDSNNSTSSTSATQPEESPPKGADAESDSERWKPGAQMTEANRHSNVSSERPNSAPESRSERSSSESESRSNRPNLESESPSERPNVAEPRSRSEQPNTRWSRSERSSSESESPSERPNVAEPRSRSEQPNTGWSRSERSSSESELRSESSTISKEDESRSLDDTNLQNTTTNESRIDKQELESSTKNTTKEDPGPNNSNSEDNS